MPKEYFHYCYIYKIDNKLHKAAYEGDFEKVKQYVSNGINIYKQTHFQETPLFLSMCKKQNQINNYLLDIYKNDLKHVMSYFTKHSDKKYTWKNSTILIAFGKDQVEEVKQLATKINIKHSNSKSIVVLLKENNFSIPEVLEINSNNDDLNLILEIIEKTFSNGVFDLNQKMLRGDTLLHVAAHQGLTDYLFQLIDMGADYKIKNNENITPVCYSALNGQIQTLKKMCDDLNIDVLEEIDENISIVLMCALHNEYETFIYLLEKVAQARSIKYTEDRNTSLANIFDTKACFVQNTLFHAVIHCGFIDFGINCLQYNPDLTTINNLGNTVLHTTIQTANSDQLAKEIIQRNYKLLLKRNKINLSPYHLMATNGKIELFIHVYETYPDVRDTFFTMDMIGYDVLEETIVKNYYEIAEFIIINYQAVLTEKLRLFRLLNIASSKNCIDLLKLLLRMDNANPNDTKLLNELQYPIITALKSRHPENFYLLYNYDVDKISCIRDSNNNNLLKYAIWKRIEKIDTDQCGSLYDSIYNINYSENDSEYQELVDEQNKKVTQIKENEKKKIIPAEEEALEIENIKYNEIFSILMNQLDYNCVNDKGRNLIFTAVKKCNVFTLEKLLKLNVDPNIVDLNGNKAIHFVTDVIILKLLLKHIDVEYINFTNKYGNTILHNIIKNYNFENPNIELLKEIINLGGDVNKRNSLGETPLHLVSGIEYYKILIKNNADVNARDNQGNTILHSALSGLNFAVAKEILRNNNIDLTILNNYNTSYLNYFVRLDDKYMKEYIDLLDNNATNNEMFKKHYNIIDQYDRPLLFVSCFNNNYCIKKILLLNDVDIKINYNGQTLLHAAVISSNMDLARYLIEHNIQLDVCDDFEKTPLMKCIEYGNDNLLLLLLENGANVNIKGNDGNVALHYACERNSITAICALLKFNSKLIENDFKKFPFDLCSSETKKLFSFLLDI